MSSARRVRVVLGAVAAFTVFALPAAPAAGKPSPPPWLHMQEGVTQPLFPFEKAIEEVVFVESEVDTDFDYTLRPLPGTRLTLDPEDSKVTLPVVGGSSALGF